MAEAEALFNGSLIKKFGKALPDDEIMKLIGAATVAGAVPMMPNAPNPFLGQGPTKEAGPASAPKASAFSDLVAKATTEKPKPDKGEKA